MELQEGQPIDETFMGHARAYAAFCPCSEYAAQMIIGKRSYHSETIYNMMVKRQTETAVISLEAYLDEWNIMREEDEAEDES